MITVTVAPSKNCSPSRVAKYQGLRKPKCHGGKGCQACWTKYRSPEVVAERQSRIRWKSHWINTDFPTRAL